MTQNKPKVMADLQSVYEIFPGLSFLTKSMLLKSANHSAVGETNEELTYTVSQLKNAREKNLMLVSMPAGISMEHVVSRMENKIHDGHLLLNTERSYSNRVMFTETKTSLGQYLVAHLPLPDSFGKDYYEQTVILADWVKNNSSLSVSPPTVEEYVEIFLKQKEGLRKMFYKYDPQKAVTILNELALNRNCREKGCEILLRSVALNKNTVPLLKNEYSWLADRSYETGRVMKFGRFVSEGAFLCPVEVNKKDDTFSKTGLYPKIK